MFGKRFWTVVLSLVTMWCAFGTSADAQEQKNELGGILGRIFISDRGIQGATFPMPTIRSGNGLTFGGEYARRFYVTPVFGLSAEGLFFWNKDEDLNSGAAGMPVVPTQYGQIFAAPAARVNLFPTTAVSPWLSVGAGFAHVSENSRLVLGGSTPNPGKNTTSGVVEFGGGLDVRVWHRLSIRGEFRDFWAGEPDFPLAPTGKSRQHNYFVGGGAFWRF